MKSIFEGVYQNDRGYWIRPTINGGRTWRKLSARNEKDAIKEGLAILGQQKRSKYGIDRDPFAPCPGTVKESVDDYLASRGSGDNTMSDGYLAAERSRLGYIVRYFGGRPVASIRISDMDGYKVWRVAKAPWGDCLNAVDRELATLSAVISHAVRIGKLETNPIQAGRPRFYKPSTASHSRTRMPENGDVVNRIAEALFSKPRTEKLGWQFLVQCMTGLRTQEAVMLRMDAQRGEPGFLEEDRLDVKRVKGGENPYVMLHPDLREVIAAHRVWHAGRSKTWFDTKRYDLWNAMRIVCRDLGLENITPHGCRAYFVCYQQRLGVSNRDVAAMIGDKTVALIETTYGKIRPGEPPLSFRPSVGSPAWAKWIPQENVVQATFEAQSIASPGATA